MASDDVILILPRREAQGLWELLEVGLAPKPKTLAMELAEKRPKPVVLVALKTVFPVAYDALQEALKRTEEETNGQ